MKIEFEVLIDDTFTVGLNAFPVTARLSFLNGFESGKWRYELFEDFLWNNISETALSIAERELLQSQPMTALKRAAKNLRMSEDKKGGEIGEILLYGLLKKHFGALPVVPKVFYKQNTQDYAKGADSVHIVVDKKGDFSLWLGEAKFYDGLTKNCIDKIVASLKATLSDEKLRKEFTIVTSLHELDKVCSADVAKRVRETLGRGISLDEIKSHLHVPILVLYECSQTATESILNDDYKLRVKSEQEGYISRYLSQQHQELSSLFCYQDITFHVILFPVPSKSTVLDAFINKAEHLRA
ncbi:MAG: DUF1837 domain-containing protein [Flavobacteriales bacterium]|nr:DUF1837 domain-containing protein [Flavobacteriales bacterium]